MSDKPVMHGRDHLPGGMDPIPVSGLQALGLPTAVYTMDLSSPITGPPGLINYDTVFTNSPTTFSVNSDPNAILQQGFYQCAAMIRFNSIQDWSGIGGTAGLGIGSATLGTASVGVQTTSSIGATPSYLDYVSVFTYLMVSGGPATVFGQFAADGVAAFPAGIYIAQAVIVRLCDAYAITVA